MTPAPAPVETPEAKARPSRRGLALLLAVVLGCLVVLFTVPGGDGEDRALDPGSAAPSGSRAVVEVLRTQGVRVATADALARAQQLGRAGTTLIVAEPARLSGAQLDQLARVPAALVLVEPGRRALRLAPGVSDAGEFLASGAASPGTCSLREGQRAGDIDAGGLLYSVTPGPGIASCYSQEGEDDSTASGVVQTRAAGRTVTVLGNGELLTNDRLGERGNAALALGVLGRTTNLTWYLPSPQDAPTGGEAGLMELLPRGVPYAAVMALFAVVVLALWRGRRLGPVVQEPLPIVVRATETTEGRARLYRRAQARDRAAEELRAASRHRLRLAAGLARRHPPQALVDAVAQRTGRSAAEVADALDGPVPTDDRGLVRLAQTLHHLEREVRRP